MITLPDPYITKSAYLSGLQCQKRLWYQFNEPSQFPPIDTATQAAFDEGHQIGELAKKLFPGGREVAPEPSSTERVIKLTAEAIRQRVPLFEAGFVFEGAYARVDVLNPVGNNQWDLIEVKNSTDVKPEHLPDLAFQRHVCAGAGLKIHKCHVLHVNGDYVRQGPIDPHQLLIKEDVTGDVLEAMQSVPRNLLEMFRTIQLAATPPVSIGSLCDSPFTCPLHSMCWKDLPKAHIFTLSRGGKKSERLFRAGVLTVKDIPTAEKLSDNQAIQHRCTVSGKPHVDKAAIKSFLDQLSYPICYLDFETINPAIPFFDRSSPYQQIPFQYSAHVATSETGALDHHSFLANGPGDPRREFMERLVDTVPATGSVVTYNASFEIGRLEECVKFLPQFELWWRKVKPRIIDLWVPFRSFSYYHPDQQGSSSMKVALPSLTTNGYDNLDIREGGAASREFLRVTFGNVSKAERAKVRKQLEAYCSLDTKGMAWIVTSLRRLVR
jgi:hypothetical protein